MLTSRTLAAALWLAVRRPAAGPPSAPSIGDDATFASQPARVLARRHVRYLPMEATPEAQLVTRGAESGIELRIHVEEGRPRVTATLALRNPSVSVTAAPPIPAALQLGRLRVQGAITGGRRGPTPQAPDANLPSGQLSRHAGRWIS
jgi:hypothetical protein